MTITDLKKYTEQINKRISPTDKLTVVLNRQAIAIIGAFLSDRKKAIENAIRDPKIGATKKANRRMELLMIKDAIECIDKAEKI